jgi:hypothetical protein
MGFFNSLVNNAGSTLGGNLVGGQKIRVKSDVKGEAKIAEATAKAQIKQADAQVKIGAKQATIEAVNAMRFDGSADDISENLNSLISMYKQLGDGTSTGSAIGKIIGLGKLGMVKKSDTDNIREAIIEKADYGLMKLNKLDVETAAFFQKKFDAIKEAKG